MRPLKKEGKNSLRNVCSILRTASPRPANHPWAGKNSSLTWRLNKRGRFAYADPFAPFIFQKGHNSKGFFVDVLDVCLAQQGIEVSYIPAHMNEIPHLLQSGKADAIAGFAVTPERREEYDFSKALIETSAGLFVKKSENPLFELLSYNKRKVCTPRRGPLVSYIRQNAPEVVLRTVEDYPAALESVLRGDADAAALNIHAGASLARDIFPGMFSLPDKGFYEVSLAVAVLKNQKPSLLQHINMGLEKIKQQGEYERIFQRWFTRS